jgi:hypothetical protein
VLQKQHARFLYRYENVGIDALATRWENRFPGYAGCGSFAQKKMGDAAIVTLYNIELTPWERGKRAQKNRRKNLRQNTNLYIDIPKYL